MHEGVFHTVGLCEEGFLGALSLHQELTPPLQIGDKLYIIERGFDADISCFFLSFWGVMFVSF